MLYLFISADPFVSRDKIARTPLQSTVQSQQSTVLSNTQHYLQSLSPSLQQQLTDTAASGTQQPKSTLSRHHSSPSSSSQLITIAHHSATHTTTTSKRPKLTKPSPSSSSSSSSSSFSPATPDDSQRGASIAQLPRTSHATDRKPADTLSTSSQSSSFALVESDSDDSILDLNLSDSQLAMTGKQNRMKKVTSSPADRLLINFGDSP